MFVIGIDPHKGSHTAAVLDERRAARRARFGCVLSRRQRDELLAFAARFEPRCWAVEGATGTGCVVGAAARRRRRGGARCATDVVGSGAAARRRDGSTRPTRTTPAPPRSSRCGTRSCGPSCARTTRRCCACSRNVTTTWSRIAPGRSVACTPCCVCWSPAASHGGFQPARAAAELRRIRPTIRSVSNVADLALELLAEVRRADRDLAELKSPHHRRGRRVDDDGHRVFGVGPVMAAYLIGYSGDVRRFPSAGHYARYNGTAPIEASSGPRDRHRLNPRGNRQLNHALHIAAVTQVRNDTPGRAVLPPQTSRRQDAAKKHSAR